MFSTSLWRAVLPLALPIALALTSLGAGAQSFYFVDEDKAEGGSLSTEAAPKPWLVQATKGWMGKLQDTTLIRNISLPGTHDSGARFGGLAYAAQTWTIEQQLNAGVRFLDIRTRRAGTEFTIHHGNAYQNISFGDVLKQVNAFLKANPSETVFMRVAEESGEGLQAMPGSEDYEKIWNRYVAAYKDLFTYGTPTKPIRWESPDSAIGDYRGKVLVLNSATHGIKDQVVGWAHPKIDNQNFYKVFYLANDNPFGEGTVSLRQKIQKFSEYIDKAATSEKWVFNHASGAEGMAPLDVARALNDVAYQKIGPYVGPRKLGLVIMDFPGEKLIYRIVQSNFNSGTIKNCDPKTYRTDSDHSFAEFVLPASKPGTRIAIQGGAYNRYVFPKCNRATWSDLQFTCLANGTWQIQGNWGADGLCHNVNTTQNYLRVGDK